MSSSIVGRWGASGGARRGAGGWQNECDRRGTGRRDGGCGPRRSRPALGAGRPLLRPPGRAGEHPVLPPGRAGGHALADQPGGPGRAGRGPARRGRLPAAPRRRGAEAFLSLPNILRGRYPLDGVTMQQILDAENSLGRLIDYGVILPRAPALYAHAASELNEPQLLEMLRDGWPVYAWPYDQRHVWTTARAPLAIRTLAKLTANTQTDQLGR